MSSQYHVSHCRVLPPGEFNVVILEPRDMLQGVATWRIQCNDPTATLKIVVHHILLFFSYAVWALVSGSFRIVSDTLVISNY